MTSQSDKFSRGDRVPQVVECGGAAHVHLTLAVTDYDHMRDLVHGIVKPDGIALTSIVLEVEEIFYRFIKHLEWDVSEMSFAKYLALTAQGDAPMVAIPVFPSRVFRHSAIYVRKDRNIAQAKDLEGKTVGIPEWAQTAGIFARGMLAETYGVDLANIQWVQAGVNHAGRVEKVELNLPKGVHYSQRADRSLSDMLRAGELDAVMSARVPDAFAAGQGDIVRLFPDYRQDETRYFEQTRIFPIMHVIAIRRAVLDPYPWIAGNLLKAFEAAKAMSLARLSDLTASRIAMPWGAALAGELARTFGRDPFPYGIEANRPTLEAFCRFGHAQGITDRLMRPEELFPAQVQGTGYKV
jgi:4,5-dihydroxyphthalate decarboxylase